MRLGYGWLGEKCAPEFLEGAVTDYRLYFMGRDGVEIERYEPIEGDCDREAIEVARLYAGIGPLELWQQGRKVHAFPELQ